jgi:polyhydroxyalkanoate synthesis regulator phasin
MNTTLKSMFIAAAALSAASSFAQDKATLDLLVKKGLITAEERAKTLDEASQARAASGINRVFPKEDATKRLTISGYFQSPV